MAARTPPAVISPEAHETARAILQRILGAWNSGYVSLSEMNANADVATIRAASRDVQAAYLQAAIDLAIEQEVVFDRGFLKGSPDRERVSLFERASLALRPVLGRALPISPEFAVRVVKAWRNGILYWPVTNSAVLRIVESAIGKGRPAPELRKELKEWRPGLRVSYPESLVILRGRLDKILARGRGGRSRRERIRTPGALASAVKELWPDLFAGRARDVTVEAGAVPTDPHEALEALIECTKVLGHHFVLREHIARYTADRPGFRRVRELAPNLCAALRQLLVSAAQVSDAEIAERVRGYSRSERPGSAYRRDTALRRIVEAFWVDRRAFPESYKAFWETQLQMNGWTDVPTWGDSFEPLEDEAERGDPLVVLPGDAWSDRCRADLMEMTEEQRAAWLELLGHAEWTNWARPPVRWMKRAAALCEPLGEELAERLASWLELMGARGSRRVNLWGWPEDPTIPRHGNNRTLRGLMWATTAPTVRPTRELFSAIAAAGIAGDAKVIRLGPRCVIVRNAAIEVLSTSTSEHAAPCLAMLDTLMKYRAGRKRSGKAVERAAAGQGLTTAQFVERTVPEYGFDGRGERTIETASGTVRIRLECPGSVRGAEGLRPAPAEVREIGRLLAAQRLRLERLLARPVEWPLEDWRRWYGDHPVVGAIARAMIWTVNGAGAAWDGSAWKDARGRRARVPAGATVAPWHPAGAGTEETAAWRERVESGAMRQPFQQAHRHVYVLTEAERESGVYSNRFAAHVLDGPRFKALLRERRWDGDPVTMFDTSMSDASLTIDHAGITAVFRTQGIEDGDNLDMFRMVATDRVEFTSTADGGRIPVHEVPALVFSEVMRDVDLFVGVASLGANHEWFDAGPDFAHAAYWQEMSFGELSEHSRSRRELVQRLLPRLKIAPDCRVDDRFLIVHGRLREYKIHLGSGNVLMSPDDRFLCIVPTSREAEAVSVQLPFEGDRTLAIILSKAMMLAEDDQITDRSITSQLRG